MPTMSHIEQRANLWYATLTVPPDVRDILGKNKFLQSTKTSNKTEAKHRAAVLVSGWKAQINKARGIAPNSADNFWESLRKQYMESDDDVRMVLADLAEQAASKVTSPVEATLLYKMATGQGEATLLSPLVDQWKGTLQYAQKTIDQQYRDMQRMADHFVYLEVLQPQRIKAWTDKLMAEGATAATFERLGNGCRSLWLYFQEASVVNIITPDPFVGAFRLALRTAVKTKTGRSGSSYTPDELNTIYAAAIANGDQPLADLIALGAYTGARIEELGRLTADTCKDGVFTIEKSKTEAGVRQVPIHTAVAPLVARLLAASTDGYLVPSNANNKYGNRTSPQGKRYGHLKKSLGFGSSHVFHSTRNTLITLMQQAEVKEGVAADNVGHRKKTLTYGLYSSGSSMAQKREAMAQVVYGGALGAP
jgi:integrase